jgi:hypothetical protein
VRKGPLEEGGKGGASPFARKGRVGALRVTPGVGLVLMAAIVASQPMNPSKYLANTSIGCEMRGRVGVAAEEDVEEDPMKGGEIVPLTRALKRAVAASMDITPGEASRGISSSSRISSRIFSAMGVKV